MLLLLLLLLLLLPCLFLFLLARRANSKVTIRLCDTILTRTAALAALPRRLSRGLLPSREAPSRPTGPERLSPVAAGARYRRQDIEGPPTSVGRQLLVM